MDFVRDLEEKWKAGSFIARFKKVLKSWTKFNDVVTNLKVNINAEGGNTSIENGRVASKDELRKWIRDSPPGARISISPMGFSWLRPESLGSFEGNDG